MTATVDLCKPTQNRCWVAYKRNSRQNVWRHNINLLSRRQVKKKLSLFPRLLIRKKFTFHRHILFCLCFEWVLLACFSSFWTWVLHCTSLICKENIKKKLFNNKLRSGEWNHSEWLITKGWSQAYFKIERSKNKMIKLRGFMYAVFLLYRNEILFSAHSRFFFSKVNENIVGTALSTNFAPVMEWKVILPTRTIF